MKKKSTRDENREMQDNKTTEKDSLPKVTLPVVRDFYQKESVADFRREGR